MWLRLVRWLAWLGLRVFAITLLCVAGWSYLWPEDRPLPRGDAIICLGGGEEDDGSIGPSSLERALTCARLHRAGVAPRVVFTGAGSGAISMAEAMAQASGLPPEAVVVEPAARSTLQNALYTLDLVAPQDRLILVTHASHLPRSWVSFRVMGAEDLALVSAGPVSTPALLGLSRESLAIWFNAVRYTIWRVAGVLGMTGDAHEMLLI